MLKYFSLLVKCPTLCQQQKQKMEKRKRKLTGDTKSHAEASLGERKIITKVEGKPKAEKY